MSSSDYAKCSHCDTPLNSIDEQPSCPNCGIPRRAPALFSECVESGLNLTNHEAVKYTSGKTNRSTIHSDSQNEPDTGKLQELIISYVEHEATDFGSYIEELVNDFNNRLCLTNPIFYRGANESIKNSLPPSNQIGPSLNPSDGRYNIVGEKCIYLIDTIDFLCAELELPSSSILVQRFDIPLDTLKIADLSTNNKGIHNSLALAFDMAESGRTSSGYFFEKELQNRCKSRYLVS